MTAFERTNIGKIRLHVLPTDQFKTYSVCVFIGQPLDEKLVTAGALIPHILRRGNQKIPETIAYRMKLDDWYGARFGFDITKRGDYQISQFQMNIINDQFVQHNQSFIKHSIQYLGDTITCPLIENNGFRSTYVLQEKETLKRRIEALINDKVRYAAVRCIQEMCENDPYRLSPLGKLDDLKEQDSHSLYQYYMEWLERALIDIYVVGDTTLDEVSALVAESFHINDSSSVETVYRQKAFHSVKKEVKRVTDRLDVTQGKLNMGFRVHTTFSDQEYPVALMYNGILGGYPHSKLFINVREKASLAYYAASRLDGHKGIMTIQSGIEIKNVDQATDIILKQIKAIEQGKISDLELEQTRAMMINQLKEIHDSPYEMIGFDFNRVLAGTKETSVQALIDHIQSMDKRQIQQYAERVTLDTIYFLRNREEE